jgi:two-component system NtrC family sensor kinase
MTNLFLLAAQVAHKMNNPLATILHKVGCLLLEDLRDMDGHALKSELEYIQDTIYSMSTITTALEAFSHDDVAHFTPVNLNEVIEKSIDVCKLLQVKDSVKYQIDLKSDLPFVFGNEITLEQCLINILRNSLEAMPDGGVLSVESSMDPAVPELIQVKIADNGIGIDPDHLEKVFDPFFTTKSEKHYGLGLSISYGILAVHQGTVRLESSPLNGTKVVLTLPRIHTLLK